jgi:DNA-binding GntR family transcriptional regulator
VKKATCSAVEAFIAAAALTKDIPAGVGVTVKEFAAGAGVTDDHARAAIERLVASGKATRIGKRGLAHVYELV